MEEKIKRKRGAQLGNQNARKHGFYSPVLDETGQQDLEKAALVEGIDEEIALLRVKLKAVIEHDPHNIKLIIQAAGVLSTLLRTKYNLGKSDKKGLKEAIGNVLRDVALPLGIGADISKFINK